MYTQENFQGFNPSGLFFENCNSVLRIMYEICYKIYNYFLSYVPPIIFVYVPVYVPNI